jgi:hypothetical protein
LIDLRTFAFARIARQQSRYKRLIPINHRKGGKF